jgi:16S rRNA processing protein RimM
MRKEEAYKIGYVLKPHGLKGEVTISLEDSPDLDEVKSVFLEQGDSLVPYFIEAISIRGTKAFLKFDDVDTPEEAQTISKCSIYLPKTSRAKSGRNEFHDDEVIGFEVIMNPDVVLGNIQEVIAAGPNKLLVLEHKGKEVMIPINGPFIKSVNKSRKRITVELPDGFLDI